MKKLFSILLSFVMVLGMGSVALAESEGTKPEETPIYADTHTVVIKKEYKLTNPGTLSPEETFRFEILPFSVRDAGAGIVATNMPMPKIGGVDYLKGEAGTANAIKEITVKLPVYKSVGVYSYTIRELPGNSAGVSYYNKDIRLVVTVIEQNGKVRVAAVHTEAQGEKKNDTFPNVYSAGDLAFSKTVTGNLGDKEKYFDVTVTLKGVTGMTYDNPYSVTGGSESSNPKTIAVGTSETFKIKDGETIKIANLPYDVTYTVVEADYEGEGYDPAVYSDFDEVIDSALDTVVITNRKEKAVDTGISLDSIPYIMILGLAVLGISGLFFRRRKNADF